MHQMAIWLYKNTSEKADLSVEKEGHRLYFANQGSWQKLEGIGFEPLRGPFQEE